MSQRVVTNAFRVVGDARFSPCMTFRYSLSRRWDPALPMALLLGINPSTAGADRDDHTTRKGIGLGRRLGFGGYELGNPFALCATDQRKLLTVADPVGPDNDAELKAMFARASVVICAWGSCKTASVRRLLDARLRNLEPLLRSRPLYCFGTTADGAPRHPLMLSYETKLEPWRLAA